MSKRLFAMLVVALCTLGLTGYAVGQELLLNPGFEDWDDNGASGPPDDWALWTANITATQEAVTVNSGLYSCNLTWTDQANQDFYQDVAVTAGNTYAWSFWAYDNDIAGRARIAIYWKDVGGSSVGSYFGGYTSDGTSWQQLSSGDQTAPVGAVTAECLIRCYDISADWDGDATVYVDDASFQETGPPPPPDTLTIPEIQFNDSNMGSGSDCYPSPEDGNTVVTKGIVTQDSILSGYHDFWIQDADTAWSGVFVYDNAIKPNIGDEVKITTVVDEYYGLTELTSVTDYTILSTGNPVPEPIDITPGDLAGGCGAHPERYEGLLVRLKLVSCAITANAYGEWYVTDICAGRDDTCQVDDYIYSYTPYLGEQFDEIVGIVRYDYGVYEIDPRNIGDIMVAVELVSFDAFAGDGQVTLTWETASEVDVHSFNIYRDGQVIASVEAFGDAHSYRYVDRNVTNGVTYTYKLSDVGLDGTETIYETVCTATPAAMPTDYALSQNYPNPFNPSTEISYALPEQAHVTLKVYNLLGQEMATLVDEVREAGRHTVSWNATGHASGVYFYSMETKDFSATKKMVFLK